MADTARDRAKEAQKIAEQWKKEFEEFEATLPEPAARTTEQWEKYVELVGERYYSMAADSNARRTHIDLDRLLDAVMEAAK